MPVFLKNIMILFVCLFVYSGSAIATTTNAPTIYVEGFESETARWKIWAKDVDDPCTVYSVGPTTERAFSGKRSLKLDLTFHEGNYCYWSGDQVKIPCAGDLKLSGYMYVEQLSSGIHVGLGRNIIFPPSGHSGCDTIATLSEPTGKWQRFELDLAGSGETGANRLLGTKDVYCYVDRIAVMFTGRFKPGQHAVVYVDDLQVTGHLPGDYESSLRQRVKQTHRDRMAQVKDWAVQAKESADEIKQLQSKLGSMLEPARHHAKLIYRRVKASIRDYGTEAQRYVEQSRWMLLRKEEQRKKQLADIRSDIEAIRQLEKNQAKYAGASFIVSIRAPILNDRLLPHDVPVPSTLVDTVHLTTTPGELEPATCALFAFEDMEDVLVQAGDLRDGAKVIPASAIDIRVVKAWYQNGISTIGFRKDRRILVSELLLKDDDLIRVDHKSKRNLMRSRDDEGRETYVDISSWNPKDNPDVAPRDAVELQPFDIPVDTLKQIWITVRVPEDAAPGDYQGNFDVIMQGEVKGKIGMQLRVLPFQLKPPLLEQSIYYGAKLDPDRAHHQVTAHYKDEKQLEAELRNMAEHGLTNPTSYQPYNDQLETVLHIRNRAGFRSGPLYTLGQGTGSSTDPEHLRSLQDEVRKWLKLATKYGHDDVYFYGMDEAKGERLILQRAAWKAVRDAGGKTFTAGYRGSFEAVGDLQDLLVFAGRANPNEIEKYHSIGHKIFSYANPQLGCEQPERYRRNYGLQLWKSGFDGAMDFAYQWEFGHIWNDFDDTRYRDHVMAYPTVDGVIDTLQWEGYREGVDDTRYLATLLDAIDKAGPARAKDADAARKWLDTLDINGDLDAIRAQMIDWILKLRKN